MGLLRRLAVAVVLALAFASPAAADSLHGSRAPSGLTPKDSAHFELHYHATGDDAITEAQAQQVLDAFESAYAIEVTPGRLGFPPPVPDADGRVDAYVDTATANTYSLPLAGTFHDTPSASRSSDWIVINRALLARDPAGTLAHEFFHVLQDAVIRDSGVPVTEATAEWAKAQVSGVAPRWPQFSYEPNAPLDCPGTTCLNGASSPGLAKGYTQWGFFVWLSERYGGGVIREIYDAAAGLGRGHFMDAIAATAGRHGSSLEQAYNEWTAAVAANAFLLPALHAVTIAHPPARVLAIDDRTLERGATSTLSVDHLGARFVGIGDSSQNCSGTPGDTLGLVLALPAGSVSQPVYVPPRGTRAIPLAVSNGRATLAVPFASCDDPGVLAVPNPSRTADAQPFVLSARVVHPPPPPVERAPVIRARAPLRVRLAGRHPRLVFTVFSSGAGWLRIELRSRPVRKRVRLRRGTNRVVLALPRSLPAGRHRLSLTAQTSGGTTGPTLRRTIRVTRPPVRRRQP